MFKPLVLGKIRARDYKGLASCTSHVSPEFHGEDFVSLRQVEAFFKKNDLFTVEADCKAAALDNFLRAEQHCRVVNKRLDFYYANRGRLDPDVDSWLSKMEQSIAWVLGDHRRFLDELPSSIRVTAGATEDRSRKRALPFLKISGKVRAPKACGPLLQSLGTWYGYPELRITNVEHNRITLVPKNWKTHRTIACEPTGSLPLQLAFDVWAKRRLRKVGVDLSSQERNQELARQGSLAGLRPYRDFCTVDLKQASDSVSYNAVAWLFPMDWFKFLASVRARSYEGCFGSGDYAKFSSMGNGATFTIETLLFWAACKAVGSSTHAVYGDDIVVERPYVESLLKLLKFLGFAVNEDKTFISGPFRESCGADWFKGRRVTPFYLRSVPKNSAGWCHVINGLAGLGYPDSPLWGLCSAVLARQKGLLFVPFNDDSMSGIWIDTPTCYAKKIIRKSWMKDSQGSRHDRQIPSYRSYTSSSTTRINRGRRALFLWHLMSPGRVTKYFDDIKESRIASEVSVGMEGSYAVNLHPYHPPTWVTSPDHLYAFTDFIVSESDKLKQARNKMHRRKTSGPPVKKGGRAGQNKQ
jgi:hypothetical protein